MTDVYALVLERPQLGENDYKRLRTAIQQCAITEGQIAWIKKPSIIESGARRDTLTII
jgi:hypothetical protein